MYPEENVDLGNKTHKDKNAYKIMIVKLQMNLSQDRPTPTTSTEYLRLWIFFFLTNSKNTLETFSSYIPEYSDPHFYSIITFSVFCCVA